MPAPSTPSAVLVRHIGLHPISTIPRLKVSWTPGNSPEVEAITWYEIYQNNTDPDAGFPGSWNLAHVTELGESSAAFVSFDSVAPTYYLLRAKNASGTSSAVPFTASLPTTTPGSGGAITAPTAVSITAQMDTSAVVLWTDSSNNDTEFIVRVTDPDAVVIDYVVRWDADSFQLTGLTPGATYTVQVAARFFDATLGTVYTSSFGPGSPLSFTQPESGPAGPATLDLYQQLAAAGSFTCYTGLEVQQWQLLNAPAGLAISPRDGTDNRIADLTGAPTTEGRYDMLVLARVRYADGTTALLNTACTVNVQGGLYLSWFHSDETRVELQVDVRARTIASYGRALWKIRRGDTQRVHILFRSGSRVIWPTLTDLALVVRLANDFDGEELVDLSGVTAETIAGHSVPYFTVTADTDFIDEIFDRLNSGPAGDIASASVEATAEVTWKTAAGWTTADRYPSAIVQDAQR